MSQRKLNSLFGKPWLRKSNTPLPFRIRQTRPIAADIELLESRALLSITLGGAGSFAVLGGSAVTNAGPSAISGNVGVSPGGAVTGFAAGQVTNGSIHVNDGPAVQAHSDLSKAYNAAAAEAVNTVLTGQDLGGKTLTPGVYFFSSSAGLTGTLTLNAMGNPNAEFVFQIGSTLTTASNSSVVMIGGGNASHVFWQVGSSATLGTGTQFEGNILALASITVTHGSSILNGSALAINGGVTLDDNAITDSNVSPTLTGLNASQYYVSKTAPLTIAPNLVVTEHNGVQITSATVSFTNWQGEDRVDFSNTLALQHTFVQDLVAHTATLTITGSASDAGYQQLLRSVTYQDVAGNPNTSAIRVATITVKDPSFSASASENLQVFNYLAGLGPVVNYVQGSVPLVIAPNLVVTPPQGFQVMSATVTFSNWQPEDRLAFSNTLALQHTFVVNLATHTATLTITGAATGAGYQTLLRSVTYQDVAGNPDTTTRSFVIALNDGTNTPSAGENVTVQKRIG